MEPRHVPKPIIQLSDIRLNLESRAGLVEILKGITLDVAEGQSLAIVGPSGSGKTSLLMILAGLERATAGDVHVAGRDFNALDEDQMALARGEDIGIVFQSFHLIPTMTALENVALPLEFSGAADARDRARSLLSDVGLGPRLDRVELDDLLGARGPRAGRQHQRQAPAPNEGAHGSRGYRHSGCARRP